LGSAARQDKDEEREVIINIALTLAVSYTAGVRSSVAKAGVIAISKHVEIGYGDKKSIHDYKHALGDIYTKATFSSNTITEMKRLVMENWMKRRTNAIQVATITASIASKNFEFATSNTRVICRRTVLL
jgi:hypothetical protein